MKAFPQISRSSLSFGLVLPFHFPSMLKFSLFIIYEYLIHYENIEFM